MKLLMVSSSVSFFKVKAFPIVNNGWTSSSSSSCSIQRDVLASRLGRAGGYRVRFLVSIPSDIIIDPDRQLMQASAVANHGLPRINGCPPSCDFGCNTKKSAGYSHESTDITRSSKIPSGLMVDLSANSKI